MVKKGANHGVMRVSIDGKSKINKSYNDLSTEWTKYDIDITEYEGFHVVSFF